MSRDRVWITVLGVLLITGGIGWLVRQQRREVPPARPTPVVAGDLEMRLTKVRLHGVDGGSIVWEVEAEHFDLVKHRPLLRVTGLHRVAVLNAGEQEMTLSADLLERNTATGQMTLRGNVSVQGKGVEMRTELADWDPLREAFQFPQRFSARMGEYMLSSMGVTRYDLKTHLLTSNGGVELAVRGNTLRAGSVKVDVATRRYVLNEPVTAELDVAALEAWMNGQALPAIPTIPPGVQERYREYRRKLQGQ